MARNNSTSGREQQSDRIAESVGEDYRTQAHEAVARNFEVVDASRKGWVGRGGSK
ncbi:hypothetical protein [Streptomyces lasiicapitis]|uniref:Uncharacterized protein n=1 Tax=Streptomyces lasiicapitis TaxID=1923961 RepID=A0ABQ2MXC9_9ACTN|nr:hypothetical protein [Streptomyces lasiicapitis]GGO60095.1 hypothetical protein GCM10012286_83200 [Streptomyces lasiicapitis]